jgi:hypothetical protein
MAGRSPDIVSSVWLGVQESLENMKTKTYQGWINTCEYGFLSLSEKQDESYGPSLADMITQDWKTGDKVSLRYYVADKPLTADQATEALLAKLYGGDLEAQYVLDAYSEYTILEWEEGLKIGGHDLVSELGTHAGKYALVIVEEPSSPNQ